RPRVASAPSSGGVAHDVEEDLLVDDREILACGVLEELLRKEHESATVTGCVIGEKLEELLGHELRRAALLKKVSEKGDELLTSAWLEVDTHAHATCERHEVDALEAFGEAEIAREDDREEGPRIELVAREDAELLEDVRGSVLRLVDEDHGADEGRSDVRAPTLAERLETAPTIRDAERDAEEVAELSVEVGERGLRPRGARGASTGRGEGGSTSRRPDRP